MITAIDHINIVVSDLESSVKFYTEILGFELLNTVHLEGGWIDKIVGLEGALADVAFIVAPVGEPRIELLRYKTPLGETISPNSLANTIGIRHMAFRVDDIHEAYERFKDAGVEFVSEPIAVPESVLPPEAGRKTLCYFYDPDGTLLEIAEFK